MYEHSIRKLGRTMFTGEKPREKLVEGIKKSSHPEFLDETWDKAREVPEDDEWQLETYLIKQEFWKYAGTVGKTGGRAVCTINPDKTPSRVDQNESNDYILNVLEAFSEWEKSHPGKYRIYADTEYDRDDSGHYMASSRILLKPVADEVTLLGLFDATENFREFASAKLNESWVGVNL